MKAIACSTGARQRKRGYEGPNDENQSDDRSEDAIGRSNIGVQHELLENRAHKGHK